jgi:succinate dehydrogenase/fumarate reductase-like Fe-S protein
MLFEEYSMITSKQIPVKKRNEKKRQNKDNGKDSGEVEVFIMGKGYKVPAGLTIMKALEYAGYRYIRGCGCRAGFCGACSTVYRIEDEQKLGFDLACQKVVEDKMYLVQLPFVPASKAEYDIDKLEPTDTTLITMYPEVARCVSCNTCTKSCPQDIETMKYIQMAIRGDIEKCAEISFDCIQCGLCAMRCPADIKHYHVSQLARRLRGKYIDPRSKNLANRLKEIENRKYDDEIEKLMKMDKKEITDIYKKRKIEAQEKKGDD